MAKQLSWDQKNARETKKFMNATEKVLLGKKKRQKKSKAKKVFDFFFKW